MPYKVAIEKPIPLLPSEPLPWRATLVSEHEDPQDAADAFDRLETAMAQAQDEEAMRSKH